MLPCMALPPMYCRCIVCSVLPSPPFLCVATVAGRTLQIPCWLGSLWEEMVQAGGKCEESDATATRCIAAAATLLMLCARVFLCAGECEAGRGEQMVAAALYCTHDIDRSIPRNERIDAPCPLPPGRAGGLASVATHTCACPAARCHCQHTQQALPIFWKEEWRARQSRAPKAHSHSSFKD